jgi:hypothetical protein
MVQIPAQRCARLKQRKAKAQKYFDEELRTTTAQRNSFSVSKTSFSPEREQRNRRSSANHPTGSRPKTHRRVRGTAETEKETGRHVAAPWSSGSDQEGRIKSVQLRWRMLRRLEIQARNVGARRQLGQSENIGDDQNRRFECDVCDRQHVGGLLGNHPFAAIVTLIGRIAGHGTAALHAFLVWSCCGQTVRKLQT